MNALEAEGLREAVEALARCDCQPAPFTAHRAYCSTLIPATPPAGGATSEGLTEAERETLLDCRSPGALDHALIPDVTFAAVERIVAAREVAAATGARAEGAEQALREAALVIGTWLRDRADSIARSAS